MGFGNSPSVSLSLAIKVWYTNQQQQYHKDLKGIAETWAQNPRFRKVSMISAHTALRQSFPNVSLPVAPGKFVKNADS